MKYTWENLRWKIARFFAIAAMLLLGGCAVIATPYTPTGKNVHALQTAGTNKVAVDSFSVINDALNRLSIRASDFKSPNNESFAAYLQTALQTELACADRFDAGSSVRVGGELQENTLIADAMTGNGLAHISARFVVQRANQTTYDKVLSSDRQWNSAFLGNVAIPQASDNYTSNVVGLLTKLFADPDFEAAIK